MRQCVGIIDEYAFSPRPYVIIINEYALTPRQYAIVMDKCSNQIYGQIRRQASYSATGYNARKQTKNGERIFHFTLNQDTKPLINKYLEIAKREKKWQAKQDIEGALKFIEKHGNPNEFEGI